MCQVVDLMHSLYLKINRKSKLHPSRHLVAVNKTSTCEIFRLIYAQLDQHTHWFLPSAPPQQAHHVESTCNWGGKLVDTDSTKNPGVFHVDFFMCIIGVHLHVDIEWIVFTFNPRCIFHVDYWCTFTGVFQVNCFTWINFVPVHVDIRWISGEECHLILFNLLSTSIFHMNYRCTYPRVYLVDIMWWLSLDFLLMCIPRGVFSRGSLV